MQIQLKQLEIEAAIKLFITGQGINILNKDVKVVFTSGRKDNGLSAEVEINDLSLAITTPLTPVRTVEPEPVQGEPADPTSKPTSLFR